MHRRIHRSWKTRAAAVAVTAVALATPVAGQRRDLQKPLVLASQGSFFVGGDTKSLGTIAGRGGPAPAGDVTVNQMYVSYQVPPGADSHSMRKAFGGVRNTVDSTGRR